MSEAEKPKYKLLYTSALSEKLIAVCTTIRDAISRGGTEITIDDVETFEDVLSKVENIRNELFQRAESREIEESMRYAESNH